MNNTGHAAFIRREAQEFGNGAIRILRIGLFISIAIAVSSAAHAQNYPWCSNFHDGAGTNCGFSTYEQCMATARGSGGYCAPNNLYVAPYPSAASGHAKHKRGMRHSGR